MILTVLGRPGQLRAALDAHVSGFMVKDAPSDQLIDVLRRVAAGERVIDPKLALATLEMKESPLSERETDVLRRFAAGADLPEIAAELFLSYGTVRNYLASAVTKLGGRNRMDAVRIATEGRLALNAGCLSERDLGGQAERAAFPPGGQVPARGFEAGREVAQAVAGRPAAASGALPASSLPSLLISSRSSPAPAVISSTQ